MTIVMTTADRLAEVKRAISALISGAQEYQVNGRRVRKAELSGLMKLETQLTAQLASEDGRDVRVAYLGER